MRKLARHQAGSWSADGQTGVKPEAGKVPADEPFPAAAATAVAQLESELARLLLLVIKSEQQSAAVQSANELKHVYKALLGEMQRGQAEASLDCTRGSSKLERLAHLLKSPALQLLAKLNKPMRTNSNVDAQSPI